MLHVAILTLFFKTSIFVSFHRMQNSKNIQHWIHSTMYGSYAYRLSVSKDDTPDNSLSLIIGRIFPGSGVEVDSGPLIFIFDGPGWLKSTDTKKHIYYTSSFVWNERFPQYFLTAFLKYKTHQICDCLTLET